MSCEKSDFAKNRCPITCPKVREQLRKAIKEFPNITDGIFPRKKNNEVLRLPVDVISKDTRDIPEQIVTKEFPVNSIEKIADRIDKEIDLNRKRIDREPAIIQEEIDIPSEKIPDIDYVEEKIDLNEKKVDEEVVIIEKEIDIPSEKIPDIDYVEEKIDLNEKKLDQEVVIIEKEIDIPSEKIPDIDYVEEKIDLNEKKLDQEVVIIEKEIDIPEKIPDIDYVEEKIDLNEEKLKREDEEHVIIQEEAVPIKRITDEKIDFVEKEDSIVERVTVEPAEEVLVAIEKQEIIEDEIERAPAAQIDLEISQELEKDFELKELEEYVEEEEEGITDYEKFIDEELRELLPAVIAREIPEEPREVERREISRNAVALYNGIDRERPVRAPREPEAVTAMPEERPVREEIPARALEDSIIDRIVSREPVVADVCDETYCLVWKQRERIIRKLKERQRIIDHYYLTKDFSYFEDICTCSLACMVYTLSRDPFVRSIFASLALFAVGLKLCSELDAWEMPSRVL